MGLFGKSRAKRLEEKAAAQGRKLDNMLANRQAVINPYSGVSDLSSMITNPFANLQVATQAAEMQAEQTDIGLASTLDVLRATGRSAGGATALAREAAQSKQGISASIEEQEADILGQTFMFQTQEQRDVADLSRVSAMQQQYGQQAMDVRAANRAMAGQIIGGVLGAGASIGSALINKG
jgi:hypothetical protein